MKKLSPGGNVGGYELKESYHHPLETMMNNPKMKMVKAKKNKVVMRATLGEAVTETVRVMEEGMEVAEDTEVVEAEVQATDTMRFKED